MQDALIGRFVAASLAILVAACGGTEVSPNEGRTKGNDATPAKATPPASGDASASNPPANGVPPAATSPKGTPPTAPPPVTPPAPVTVACATPENVVTEAFNLALGRAPDPAGLDFWVGALASGQPRSSVLENVIRSDEFASTHAAKTDAQFLDGIYRTFLNRAPDPDGQAFWLNELQNGVTRTVVALGIADSPEFHDATKNPAFACFF